MHAPDQPKAPRGGLAAKWRRLRAMDGDELRGRLGQEAAKRLDAWRSLLRLPAARPRRGRAAAPAARFYFDGPARDLAAEIRRRLPGEAAAVVARAEMFAARRFDLLGYRGLDFGRDIDWNLDPTTGRRASAKPWPSVPYLDYAAVGDHKVVWELGRHQHLTALARAWLYSGDERFRREAIEQWRDWRRKNPYPRGIHWTSALEVAFRALSWLWLSRLFDGEDAVAREFRGELEEAAGHSALYLERFLSTYFSPNTHLLGEAAALYALGTLLGGFERAPIWRETGRRIVVAELARQTRADGTYFEQSVYYHVYALDFAQHFLLLARRNDDAAPAEFEETAERMAELLRRLSQGGAAPRFGDDDGGRLFDPRRNRPEHLLDPLATAAVVFGRGDFAAAAGELREETAWLTGLDGLRRWDGLERKAAPAESYRHDAGGFHVLVSRETPPRALILDAGPLGALAGGHGHADGLSVQWFRGGRGWLIDPGTGRYPRETPERDRFRSTAAHSTLCVDETGEAVPTGSFSWESLPGTVTESWVAGRLLTAAAGRRRGYEREPIGVTHLRWALQFDDGLAFVRDVAEGRGEHLLELHWRVGPEFRIANLTPDEVIFAADDDRLRFVAPRDAAWAREIWEDLWSPCYGETAPAPVIRYRARTSLPAEWAVALDPSGGEGERRLVREAAGAGVAVYRYEIAGAEIVVAFGGGEAAVWTWGPWRTDARLLVWRTRGAERALLVHHAGSLAFEGATVFEGDDAVERFEWDSALGAQASDEAAARRANLQPFGAVAPKPAGGAGRRRPKPSPGAGG